MTNQEILSSIIKLERHYIVGYFQDGEFWSNGQKLDAANAHDKKVADDKKYGREHSIVMVVTGDTYADVTSAITKEWQAILHQFKSQVDPV